MKQLRWYKEKPFDEGEKEVAGTKGEDESWGETEAFWSGNKGGEEDDDGWTLPQGVGGRQRWGWRPGALAWTEGSGANRPRGYVRAVFGF